MDVFDEKVGYLSCKIFDIKLNDGKKVLIDKYRGLTKTPIRQAYMIEYYPTGVIKKGGNPIFHDFRINGVRIKFQGNFDTGILVTTPDLRGLYYNRPNK